MKIIRHRLIQLMLVILLKFVEGLVFVAFVLVFAMYCSSPTRTELKMEEPPALQETIEKVERLAIPIKEKTEIVHKIKESNAYSQEAYENLNKAIVEIESLKKEVEDLKKSREDDLTKIAELERELSEYRFYKGLFFGAISFIVFAMVIGTALKFRGLLSFP